MVDWREDLYIFSFIEIFSHLWNMADNLNCFLRLCSIYSVDKVLELLKLDAICRVFTGFKYE